MRSFDGKNFVPIGKVVAIGNSSQTSNYGFTDQQPILNGSNYYRLQEVDLDGNAEYSAIKYVSFVQEGALDVRIYPNPVKDILNIVVVSDNTKIELRDLNGKGLYVLPLSPGTHQINLGGLPAGVYELLISQNEKVLGSRRIVKLK